MRHAAALALWICAAGAAVDLVLFCRFFSIPMPQDCRLGQDSVAFSALCQWFRSLHDVCDEAAVGQRPEMGFCGSSSDWPIRFEAMLTSLPPVFLYSRYAIQRCLLLMPSSLLAFFQKTLAGRTGEPIWLSNWRFFCESAESQHSENPMSLSPGVLGSIQETLANLRSRECVEGGCSKCQPQHLKVKHWTLKRGGMKCY